MRHNLKGGHGNCIAQDSTEILTLVNDRETNELSADILDMTTARRHDMKLRRSLRRSSMKTIVIIVTYLTVVSEYKEAPISYNAGYVVRMVARKIKCDTYIAALHTSKDKAPDLFVSWKSHGGLKIPTDDVLQEKPEKPKSLSSRRQSLRS
ncbi:uncharacterized protein LOC124458335 [Xenia sp. Carnegie-2017]|uniref:uncharacterized protein LOC124458335 n=1 Tax=Xenia sp. Carnegie-2017 TaxID=2897299 RepID=UPI001F03E08C|nr:uncharacterized protein LOC124458335 [Xenia sp. Carnegie-2017]